MAGTEKQPTELGKLANQCREDSVKWFGDRDIEGHAGMMHCTLALAGEVGEFANILKKIDRGSLAYKDAEVRYDLAMELTDVLVYVLNLAGIMRIDLGETYKMVRANNDKRFMKERGARDAQQEGKSA